ncbi:MAG: hypothetical protein JWM38_2146 [Sphingomonas bacterium]|nr:hypothetical protein [Sphingomonas bacterium]
MKAYEHLGDYAQNSAFAAFHDLSVRAFAMYADGVRRADAARPIVDLIRRMMYVAEASSAGLRLNASWALSHPAFSLCRDRYEQCVRFSWLARQTDAREWYRYIADYYLTRHRLKNAFQQSGIDLPVDLDDGLAEAPAYVRERFAYWRNTPVDQMARKRDALAGITGSRVDREALVGFYDSIYRQGSSVAHYDLYSINMLGLYDNGFGLILAPDPGLPIVMVLHCAMFDIVQCAEALARTDVPAPADAADALVGEWWECVRRTGMLDPPR